MTQPSLFESEDDLARRAIVERLDHTLFVEAGAGSGKTKSLVDRVHALVMDGVPMREIAAITFTEKAAAELRDRIRQRFEASAREPGNAGTYARAALDELDGAAISTLHAFAQRLLSENPIEAGLPPGLEVADEIGSQVAFEERWSRFFDRLLATPELARSLLLLGAAGVRHTRLRDLAVACNDNWDLVAQRMQGDEPDPPVVDVEWLLAGLDEVCALRSQCRDAADRMVARLDEFEEYANRLRAATDEYARYELLYEREPSFKVGNTGRKESWRFGLCDLDALRATIRALDAQREECRKVVAEAAARRLAVEIGRFTLEEAEERRRSGQLEFHDLLVLARRMVRDPRSGWEVRRRVRARYSRLLLDEFQDTDPIQCDLAVLLASDDPAAADKAWDQVPIEPGRLFVVGDPKQSIYRFRRADVHAYLTARTAFGSAPNATLHLTRNFRTSAPVIDFVNDVFRDLIVFDPDSQPEYVPLDPERAAAPSGPPVVLLGADEHPQGWSADALRAAEAADVAAAVQTAIAQGWMVYRRGEPGREGRWERCRLGDICVLLPARTSLGHLEDALDQIGVPYRAETSSLVYGTREIRDLLAVLSAVDDPTDELALVTALRTPLLGCGDDDLYTYRVEHDGRWNHQAPLPDTLPPGHPVGDAIVALRDWYAARAWSSPSELIEHIVRERRVLELGFARGRPRDLWRRVRFVVDQARAFAEAQGGGLREFLVWADLQSAEGARVVETVLPETDDDAVRILTVHGAKGLEFPITILSGMTTAARNPQTGVRLLFPHDKPTWALKIGKHVTTEEFERYLPIDEQMDFHEKLRLLYVAATRAQDHLVVSVHRSPKKEPSSDKTRWTHAELFWNSARDARNWERLPPVAQAPLPEPAPVPARPPLPAFDAWQAERDAAFTRGVRSRVRAATAIAKEAAAAVERDPGLAKDARDLELPPWNKGRYGTSIGRAVHAVLQTIDLRTGAGIVETARAQAAAEGVIGREDDIVALARSALATDTMREAVASQFWRETYVASPVGDQTLEGYVDLIYRTPDGLVVVDYKTDSVDDDDLDTALARYRLQGASYALAVAQATGEPVVRCVFLFLHADGARTREVADLEAAVDEVRRFLADA